MFLHNLMSMDTEEMIRAQPVDACIVVDGLSANQAGAAAARRPQAQRQQLHDGPA
ncbi:MAG: hypothetical protein STHCBS139747_004954 [Sporothrix thermara]